MPQGFSAGITTRYKFSLASFIVDRIHYLLKIVSFLVLFMYITVYLQFIFVIYICWFRKMADVEATQCRFEASFVTLLLSLFLVVVIVFLYIG